MLGVLSRTGRTVRALIAVAWPCWFAATVTLFVSAGMLHEQMIDALAAVSEERNQVAANLSIILPLVALSVSAWYVCRALLYVSYPGNAAPPSYAENAVQLLRTWLPRMLAFAPFLGVALAFLSSDIYALFLLYIVLGVALLGLLVYRRRLFMANAPIDTGTANLPHTTRHVLLGAVGAILLSLILLLVFPIGLSTLVGPIGIILAACSSWIVIASLALIYPTHRFQLPSLFAIAILAAIVFGLWNDNHALRSVEQRDLFPVVGTERSEPVDHFTEWLRERGVALESGSGERELPPYPVFVVTAEGGGIRAAYWTAAVLRHLDKEIPNFHRHVFAISGVSGGSLGAAVFAADIAQQVSRRGLRNLDCQPRPENHMVNAESLRTTSAYPASADHRSANNEAHRSLRDDEDSGNILKVLGEDFLTPVLAGALYPDFIQRFLPVSGSLALPDRASYLERSWERAWRNEMKSALFEEDFSALWKGDRKYAVPSLLLNATWVETGGRAVVSNLRLEHSEVAGHRRSLPYVDDLLSRVGKPLRTSTAIHLSARFTYLSPPATVVDTHTGSTRRAVDGGYFENSGATTATQLLDLIGPRCDFLRHAEGAQKENPHSPVCRIYVLIISNDVLNPNRSIETALQANVDAGGCVSDLSDRRRRNAPIEPSDASIRLLTETLAPVEALLATRRARGQVAERGLLEHRHNCRAFRFQLRPSPDRAIPLGWVLSRSMRREIGRQVQNDSTTERVRSILQRYRENSGIRPGIRSADNGGPADL